MKLRKLNPKQFSYIWHLLTPSEKSNTSSNEWWEGIMHQGLGASQGGVEQLGVGQKPEILNY